MSSLAPRRGPGRPARLALPLPLVLAVTGALAWSAWDADRSRRATVEATVRDYAGFAATLLARNAEAELGPTLLYAFYRVELAERQESTDPVRAVALADNSPEAARCGAVYPRGRWFARLPVGGGASEASLEAVGPLPAGERAWLARSLAYRAAAAARSPRGSPYGLLFPPGEDPTPLVAYRIRAGFVTAFVTTAGAPNRNA